MDSLYLPTAPPLDPAWLAYERAHNLDAPRPAISDLDRQPIYAEECRTLNARLMAPGARDHHLSAGIQSATFTVPSSLDGHPIPVLRLTLEAPSSSGGTANRTPADGPPVVAVYIHGGGLKVGEADSEELSCRRIMHDAGLPNLTLYSIGYRLMPAHPASTCVQDCLDATSHILALPSTTTTTTDQAPKVLVIGSSSGGELAAFVAGHFTRARVHGLALRCPVTSDAFGGADPYVPARLRRLHTSAAHPSFRTCLLGHMGRDVARDGLAYMPLEMAEGELRGMPARTWVQVCTNDGLYSDGVCFARALQEVGVDVRVDVVVGWPHTFWLKAPELERALEAERAMLAGLRWLVGVEES